MRTASCTQLKTLCRAFAVALASLCLRALVLLIPTICLTDPTHIRRSPVCIYSVLIPYRSHASSALLTAILRTDATARDAVHKLLTDAYKY